MIDEFVSARLLVVDRDDHTREPTLEVAHEALLRDWPRLAQWIDEDGDDLSVPRGITGATADWINSGRDEGLLARGGRLELNTELVDRRPELLNANEQEWMDRSREAAVAETAQIARQQRRLQQLLTGVAALAADGDIIWTPPAGQVSRGIGGPAGSLVASRSEADRSSGTEFVFTNSGVEIDITGTDQVLGSADFSPDGRLLAMSDTNLGNGVMLYGVDDSLVSSLHGRASGVERDSTSDGDILVVGTNAGDVVGFDVDLLQAGVSTEEAERFRLDAHDSLILTTVISPDGRLLASTAQNEPARVWEIQTGRRIAEFGTGADVTGIAFHRTEPWVYVVDSGGISVHTLDVDRLLDAARSDVPRDLTETE